MSFIKAGVVGALTPIQVENATPGSRRMRPHLSMYDSPPSCEVSIEDFERHAIDRLKVLKGIEDAKIRGRKDAELRDVIRGLVQKHLKGVTRQAEIEKDEISHHVLQLAYCRTEELRRWLLMQECELFRTRFADMPPEDQTAFMQSQGLSLSPASGAEVEALRPQLRQVELSQFNQARAASIAEGTYSAFFKVPFEEVPELVAQRKVLLVGGSAYVAREHASVLVAGQFRSGLSRSLTKLAPRWSSCLAALEADRLAPLVEGLSSRYLGADYSETRGGGRVALRSQLPVLAQQSFPLCMQTLYSSLRAEHHLRHNGRQQLGLFLKGIGLPLEEALAFWKQEFGPRVPAEAFEKQYAYNVRHNYGREGKRTDYTPFSCLKIISMTPGTGECHGCPFKTFDEPALRAALQRMGLKPRAMAEVLAKAKGQHYQVACTGVFEAVHDTSLDMGINHPNQYFEESRKVLDSASAAGSTTPSPPPKGVSPAGMPGSARAGPRTQLPTPYTPLAPKPEAPARSLSQPGPNRTPGPAG